MAHTQLMAKVVEAASASSASSPAPVIVSGPPSWLVSLLGPVLVLIVGGTFLAFNHLAITSLVRQSVSNRVELNTERAQTRMVEVFGSADQILNAMNGLFSRASDQTESLAIANEMYAIITDRPGVSCVSLIAQNGEGLSVEYQDELGYVLNRAVLNENGMLQIKRWTLKADGSMALIEGELSQVPDRRATLLKNADGHQERFWSSPQPVIGLGCGIAYIEPVRHGDKLAGILAVSFCLDRVSALLDQMYATDPAWRFVFTENRELIGLPKAWIPTDLPDERSLTVADVQQPIAWSFFNALPDINKKEQTGELHWMKTNGETYAAAITKIEAPHGGSWQLGALIPRERLVGDLDFYHNLGYVAGVLVVLMAVALGLWKTKVWTGIGTALVSANMRAQSAEAKVKELGAYDLVKPLGKGSMGEVWLAQHRLLTRPAAIKLIKSEALDGGDIELRAETRKRFAFEACITATLSSRYTIELYDYGMAEDGTFYYVMELLDGIDLKELVTKFGPVPAARAVKFLIMVCQSLGEAHERGLVHRDVKPENLFICRRAGEVDLIKVLDFGIVRLETQHPQAVVSRAGSIKGSPSTMSPEQINNKKLDGRSDLYSLGCVAYWLLTGEHVFESKNYVKMLTDHVQTDPPPMEPRTTNFIPPQLSALVMRLLSKNPNDRPESARVCAQLLAKIDLAGAEPWTQSMQVAWWKKYLPPKKDAPHVGQTTQQFVPSNL